MRTLLTIIIVSVIAFPDRADAFQSRNTAQSAVVRGIGLYNSGDYSGAENAFA